MSRSTCFCDWNDCSSLYEQLKSILPPDHVWVQPSFFQIQKDSTTYKKLAQRSAVAHHFHLPANSRDLVYFVAPHHYHQNLLQQQRQRATLLTKDTAKRLDASNMVENRLCDEVNKLENRLPKKEIEKLRAEGESAELAKYVQAPVCS